MTLKKAVLEKLNDGASARRSTLTVNDAVTGWHVAITSDRRDEIGCALWEVALSFNGGPASRGDVQNADWARRAAASIRGLLEPIQVIEVDATRDEAMLRSEPPARQSDHVSYYEIMLQGVRSATIRRYVAALAGSERREQVTFTLTNEVLANLIADVAGER